MSISEKNQAEITKLEAAFREAAKAAKVEGGEVTIDGKEVFEGNLPEGITTDTVKTLQNYVGNTAAAGHKVAGEIGVEAMAADTGLDKFKATINLGPIGKMTSYVQREFTGRDPKDPGKEIKIIGQNRLAFDLLASGGERFNVAKEAIKALAAEKL